MPYANKELAPSEEFTDILFDAAAAVNNAMHLCESKGHPELAALLRQTGCMLMTPPGMDRGGERAIAVMENILGRQVSPFTLDLDDKVRIRACVEDILERHNAVAAELAKLDF